MKLTLPERFAILRLLPTESDYTMLKVVRDFQEKLAPSENEIKKFGIKSFLDHQGNTRTQWNESEAKAVDIKVSDIQSSLVEESLSKLNKDKKLTQEHFTLYEKFVKGKK